MCYCPTPTLHLNLALTGDCAFLFSLKKTHSVWFISVLNYGDTENVLINHLLLVIPMLYPCHYTNLCPHKPHKHAHTHTHTHRHRESSVVITKVSDVHPCRAKGRMEKEKWWKKKLYEDTKNVLLWMRRKRIVEMGMTQTLTSRETTSWIRSQIL